MTAVAYPGVLEGVHAELAALRLRLSSIEQQLEAIVLVADRAGTAVASLVHTEARTRAAEQGRRVAEVLDPEIGAIMELELDAAAFEDQTAATPFGFAMNERVGVWIHIGSTDKIASGRFDGYRADGKCRVALEGASTWTGPVEDVFQLPARCGGGGR